MITDRANAICLLEILREYSDENNILQMKDIILKMNNLYGISPDRRTVYSAAALLNDMGFDISIYEENKVGYYLRSRNFEQSEIMLLTDAVYSFPFITAKQSEDLIRKLQKELSVNQRKNYKHLRVVKHNKKTGNQEVFLNLEQIDQAISERKQIEFTYMQYEIDKKLHPRRKESYVAEPYGVVYMNEHYYLICSLVSYPKISLYRLDRMKNVRILETSILNMPDTNAVVDKAIYGFTGEPEHIEIRCKKNILSDVIDKFGSEIYISEIDDDNFAVHLFVAPYGVKFWALQYLPYAEVVEPTWLRNEIIESVKGNPYGIVFSKE